MNKTITDRVASLRGYMKEHGLSAFVVPSTDAHAGEYIPAHWASREWISGFNGSAGTAVVTLDDAALWTDSRYFLAAADQLEGTGFRLMKDRIEGTPTVAEWLISLLKEGDTVGIDGYVNAVTDADELRQTLRKTGIALNTDFDPMAELWENRPALPDDKVIVQPMKYAGETCRSKVNRLRGMLREKGCDTMLVSALDDVAWLLNLRGTDVHCNPVFVAYCLVKPDSVTLYIHQEKLTDEVNRYLAGEGIEIHPYDATANELAALKGAKILLVPTVNAFLAAKVAEGCEVQYVPSPVATMKAIKNETEIEGYRRSMLRDGVALVKFLRRLPEAVEKGITEIGVDELLTGLRAENPEFRDISFDTIAGYGDHGAIVHYEAKPATDRKLEARSLLLLDSGAQYEDGTTDITRTIALGPLTEEEKHVYTLVLKGHIMLSRCVFPKNASGTQLDLAARYAMWQEGYNFGHGTGHGVGSYLNVHEGPHQIRMNYMPAPLVAGMTLTDEPGLYLTGKFGARTENMLLIVPFCENEFGSFLRFEPLTLCPIDTKPIDFSIFTTEERQWLNDYHHTVRERLMPLLDDDADRRWLDEATRPI